MNRQEVFDKVVERAKQMTKPAINSEGNCCYRSPNGPCLIGYLIKDEVYSSTMENKSADELEIFEALVASGVDVNEGDDEEFLLQIQVLHDRFDPNIRGAAFRSKLLSKLKKFSESRTDVVFNS